MMTSINPIFYRAGLAQLSKASEGADTSVVKEDSGCNTKNDMPEA